MTKWETMLAEAVEFDTQEAAKEAVAHWEKGGTLEIIIPRVALNWEVDADAVTAVVQKIVTGV